jgi:hypothetical protein
VDSLIFKQSSLTLEELNKMLTSKEVSLSDRNAFSNNAVEISYVKTTKGAPTGVAAVDSEYCLNTYESQLYLRYSGVWYKLENTFPASVKKGKRYVHSLTGADTTGASGDYAATNEVMVREGNDAVYSSPTTVLKISNGSYYNTGANEYCQLSSVSTGGGKYLIEFDAGGTAASVAGYTNITVTVTGLTAQAIATLVAAGIAALSAANNDFKALAVSSYVVITDKRNSANTPSATSSNATSAVVGASRTLAYKYLAF